jgi:23S rRNA G2069 N7-methylase RlmK/C1962 C5-methylase RlmI
VDSVDLSHTYLRWGIENFRINGFGGGLFPAPAVLGLRGAVPALRECSIRERCRFIPGEARSFLAAAEGRGLFWDRIILDPPGFSNSKRMRGTLDIRRDHRELILRCLRLLNPGGVLYFCANRRGFRLDGELAVEDFRAPGAPPCKIRDLGRALVDEDFRGRPPPRCWAFEV